MRRLRRLVLTVVLAASMAASLEASPSVASHGEGAPPEVGTAVLEDPLTGPGTVFSAVCPTGRSLRRFVGDGYLLQVAGPCTEASTSANIAVPIRNLTLRDGEVRLDLRGVSGLDRMVVRLRFRSQPGGGSGYLAVVEPARGHAELRKVVDDEAGASLAARTDPAGLLALQDWSTLAVRAEGPHLRLLLNDQPILAAADPAYDAGGVSFSLLRIGESSDEDETAVVLRNLRVSGLANGDHGRVPRYTRPPELSAAPDAGASVLEDALTAAGVMSPGMCPTGANASRFVEAGYSLTVRGKCSETSTGASVVEPIWCFPMAKLHLRCAS